ncbi:hypothetical protein D3C86_243400 [compost metagenome]
MMWIVAGIVLLGALLLGFLVTRDPEAGFVTDLDPQLQVKAEFLAPLPFALFQILREPLAAQGLLLFPKMRLADVFERGRLTPTGWHRLSRSQADFVIVDQDFLAPMALILIEGDRPTDYLDKENTDLKGAAIADAGLPLLRVNAEPTDNPADLGQDVLDWVSTVVLPYAKGQRG